MRSTFAEKMNNDSEGVRLLSAEEFKATFLGTPRRLPAEADPPFDFWPYFDQIPEEDFGGYDCSDGRVENAWEMPEGSIQHVLVSSNDKNVFMVLVLHTAEKKVIGHRLLDLNREYGLTGEQGAVGNEDHHGAD